MERDNNLYLLTPEQSLYMGRLVDTIKKRDQFFDNYLDSPLDPANSWLWINKTIFHTYRMCIALGMLPEADWAMEKEIA